MHQEYFSIAILVIAKWVAFLKKHIDLVKESIIIIIIPTCLFMFFLLIIYFRMKALLDIIICSNVMFMLLL